MRHRVKMKVCGIVLGFVLSVFLWQQAIAAPTFTVKDAMNNNAVVNNDDTLKLKEGLPFQLLIEAQKDNPNATIEFYVTNTKSWMIKEKIGETLWYFKGTPPADTATTTLQTSSVGEYEIEMFVEEQGGLPSTSVSITLRVENNNTAPKITGTPVTEVTQGENYSFQIGVDDLDKIHGETIKWEIFYNNAILPQNFWLELVPDPSDPDNTFKRILKNVEGRPTNDDVFKDGKLANKYPLEIKVTDGGNLTDSINFEVTVKNKNDKPTIAKEPLPPNRVKQDEPYTYTITVTDIDATDTMTYSTESLPDWLELVLDTNDPMNSYKRILKSKVGRPNNSDVKAEPYEFKVKVTDNGTPPESDEIGFSITVVNKNDAPQIKKLDIINPADQDTPYSLPIEVVDIDNDELLYELTDKDGNPLPDDFWLTLSDTEPVRAPGPFKKYLVSKDKRPNNDDVFAGPYTLKLKVTDKGKTDGVDDPKSDEWTFTITVRNKNDKPVIAKQPVPPATINQGDTFEYEVVATDIDVNDILTFEAVKLPNWLELKAPVTRGAVVNKTVIIKSKEGRPNNADVSTTPYDVEIKVKDNGKTPDGKKDDIGEDTLSFKITVNNVNDAPTWKTTEVPPNSVYQGKSYSFILEVDDPDKIHGQTIQTYKITPAEGFNSPDWLEIVPEPTRQDNTFRRLVRNKTGRPNNDDVGIYKFSVTASDDGTPEPAKETPPKDFIIFVKNVNDAPTISTKEPIPIMKPGQTYEIFVIGDDVDKYPEGKPATESDKLPPEAEWDKNNLTYLFKNPLNLEWITWDRNNKKVTITPPVNLFGKRAVSDIKKFTGISVSVNDRINNPTNIKTAELPLNFMVVKPGIAIEKGNFNLDGAVGLDDAIIVLQILAGITPAITIDLFKEIDVLEDGKIGIEDLLFILQKVTVNQTVTRTTTLW